MKGKRFLGVFISATMVLSFAQTAMAENGAGDEVTVTEEFAPLGNDVDLPEIPIGSPTPKPTEGVSPTPTAAASQPVQLTDNISYTFNEETGTLTISGEGEWEAYIDETGKTNSPFSEEIFEKTTKIVIEDGVENVPDWAFYYRTFTEEEENVIYIGSCIDDHMFSNVDSVVIGKDVKSIGKGGFFGTKIEQILIPDGVTSIGMGAFGECNELNSILLPKSLTELGDCTFMFCNKLQSVAIWGDVKELPVHLFSSCRSLERVSLPEGLKTIGPSAFWGCGQLDNVSIPQSVEKIDYKAFYRCNSLKSVILPDGLKELDPYAFSGSAVETVSLPNVSRSVMFHGFEECDSLKDVIYRGTYSEWKANGYTLDDFGGMKLHFTPTEDGVVSGLFEDEGIPLYAYEYDTENGVLSFMGNGDSCFDLSFVGLIKLLHDSRADEFISIPEGTREKLKDISNIKTIVLVDGFTSVGYGALAYGFQSHNEVPDFSFDLIITAPIEAIRMGAFSGAPVRSVVLPDTLEHIGLASFAKSKLQSVSIPANVTNIEGLAFYGCHELKTIDLPSSIQIIENGAFYDCPEVTDIYYHGTWQDYNLGKVYDRETIPVFLANDPFMSNVRFDTLMPDEATVDKWEKIDGDWYGYRNGRALSGVVAYKGKLYRLDKNGKMLTGWQKIGGEWYYFKKDAMSFGWQKIDGKWYYLQPSTGVMLKSCLKVIDGKTYAFNSKGELVTGKWIEMTYHGPYNGTDTYKVWYKTDRNGEILTNTVVRYGGADYTLDEFGMMESDEATAVRNAYRDFLGE